MAEEISFPHQFARTQRFTLGTPRAFTVARDGSRIAFLRSAAGDDPTLCLWVHETASGAEHIVADPGAILGGADEELPPEERARRERVRQTAAGLVAYATDGAGQLAAFTLSGRLFTAGLADGTISELPATGPVFDPRPDPTGSHVAYVSGGALRVVATDGSGDRALAEPDGPEVTYGLAEFVAAEEMSRRRGYWWSPEGDKLLIARVDVSPVTTWYVSDPANPDRPATAIRYPVAGTANADVTVILAGLDGSRQPVSWDTAAFPYLTSVHWSANGPALLQVQTRDQRTVQVLAVQADGSTTVLATDSDPAWVSLVTGTPAWTPGGELVRVAAQEGAYRLLIADQPVTPAGPDALHVREVLDVGSDVLFTATAADPTVVHVYTASAAGVSRVTDTAGLHTATRGGPDVLVVTSAALDRPGPHTAVLRAGSPAGEIASHAQTPPLVPDVTMLTVGEHGLRCALVLPRGHRPGEGPALPVLMDPYGGPGAQRVLSAQNAYLEAQWFADQGFAVLVADGRGTPGRGPVWDRLIQYEEAALNLEDQVAALQGVAASRQDLDTSRVAIRGWSHGGYLAALAVLRRPDVFHAAVAGAPVTDQRLYDTHYTERYLGHPDEHPDVYERNSLIADAPKLRRPLMLVHGLADDNVVIAHTLRMSQALLLAGRPHTVLPLSGLTHMARRQGITENLMMLEVEFIRRSLGISPPA